MIKPFGPKAARFIKRAPAQDATINLLDGSTGAAKTWAANAKFVSVLAQGYWPGGTGLITGNSKTSIKTNVLNDIFAIIGEKRYRYNSQSGELILCGRPFLVCGAKDEGSWKAIRGSTVGLWLGDEATLYPQSFFDMAVSRLRVAGSRAYLTTNPGPPFHYLKSDYIDNPEKRAQGDFWYEHFTLDDNPNMPEERKAFLRRQFVGVFKLRYIDGLWVQAEGAIYRDCLGEHTWYTDSTRPLGLHSRGGHAEHWLAIDYGTVNQLAVLDIYDDGKTVWWDREYCWDSRKENKQKTDAQYADDIIDFVGRRKDQREWPGVIIDPSAASLRVELVQRGFHVIDADNSVEDGIRRVSSLLALGRIRINKERCPITKTQMEAYAWDNKKAEKSGKEQPVKMNDHMPDAGRYHAQTRINDWRLAA